MSVTIKLGHTNDPINKVDPTFTGTTLTNALLKDRTSVEQPTLLLDVPSGQSAAMYTGKNMVYIQEFGRYYDITGIDFAGANRIIYSTNVNVLKSFAADIKANSLYVARNENEYDARILDNERIVQEGNNYLSASHSEALFTPGTPTYVVQTANDSPGMSVYIMNEKAFKDLIHGFWSINWSAIIDLGQASKFIVKSFMIPCELSAIVSKGVGPYDFLSVGAIGLGNSSISLTTSGASAYLVDPSAYVLRWGTQAVTIAATYQDWRDSLTDYYFYFPYCGELRVNGAAVNDGLNFPQLTAKYDLDLTSGDIGVEIELGSSYSLSYYISGNCAVSVPITSDNVVERMGDFVTGATQLVMGVGSGDVGSMFSGAKNIISAAGAHISYSGGVSSSLGWKLPQGTYYQKKYKNYITNYSHTRGRPLYQWRLGSALSGYTLCENVQLTYGAGTTPTVSEKAAIKQALESGVIF